MHSEQTNILLHIYIDRIFGSHQLREISPKLPLPASLSEWRRYPLDLSLSLKNFRGKFRDASYLTYHMSEIPPKPPFPIPLVVPAASRPSSGPRGMSWKVW